MLVRSCDVRSEERDVVQSPMRNLVLHIPTVQFNMIPMRSERHICMIYPKNALQINVADMTESFGQ